MEEKTTSKISDVVSGVVEHVIELTKERIFTPMYFYFLIAWIVTNWKFVFILLFVDNQFIWDTQKVLKVDYLSQMYGYDLLSLSHLLLIPFVFSYLAIWWLSQISENFYQRYEEHQMNKRVIKRGIDYKERVVNAMAEKQVRKEEIDNKMNYEDNSDFNEWFDEQNEALDVGGISLSPSEALYKTDYVAYKAAFDEYLDQQEKVVEDIVAEQVLNKRRGK